MKTIVALAVMAPVFVACGGGSSADPELLADPVTDDAFNADGPVVNACASNYYQELIGDYDGQINYIASDDSLSCSWEVEFQITDAYTLDPVNRRICDLTMNMASTSGNPTGCADVGTGGQVSEPFKSIFMLEQLTTPVWPVEVDTLLNSVLPDSAVYPTGDTGSVSVIALLFDGLGNAVFPATLNASPEWSGVLVKQ